MGGLTALALFFVEDATLQETLQRVVDLTAAVVPAVAWASITLLVEGRPRTAASTEDLVGEVDQAQYATGEGPCLDAYSEQTTKRMSTVRTDERWPEFSRAAAAHGVNSVLSVPLIASGRGMGTLNMYGSTESAFSPNDEAAAEVFAAQATAVLANSLAYWDARGLSENLTEAMKSRAVIEQAKGILMGQSNIDADAAFAMLVRVSQRQNQKLRDVAADLVTLHSGGPDAPAGAPADRLNAEGPDL
jgi:GAF domain-containing protein